MSSEPHFPYLPHTDEQRREMLKEIGVQRFEDLVTRIPKEVRAGELDLPEGLSELELIRHIASLASKNKPAGSLSLFLGGGSYHRFVPAVVPAIVSRSEFATAYTPYQAEASQGTLQTIYEFQSAICMLTGMDVANASMYDGATACAEAALMACRITGRKKVIIPDSLNPDYRAVTGTYTHPCGVELSHVVCRQGTAADSKLDIDADTAALIVQHPNYFGCLEPLAKLSDIAHEHGALLIVAADPICLGLLEPPGAFGADIAVGDAQPCGNYLSYGGPSAGYMATRGQFTRQLPGRLAGATVDNRGQRAYTLTLQTREQHIRRAGATSNICTNQALNALSMLAYLCVLGPDGLSEVAELSTRRAHYLAQELSALPGISLFFDRPFFSEFVLKLDCPVRDFLDELAAQDIVGGLPLERFYPQHKNTLLVAVTEMNSAQEIDAYAKAASRIVSGRASAQRSPEHARVKA